MQDVTAYVRAHAVPRLPERTSAQIRMPGWRPLRFGERVLVFDTETSLDPSQRCLVGAYRLSRWNGRSYDLVEDGLVQGDGLDRNEGRCLARYAETHGLPLLSRAEFCTLLIREGYDLGTLIVGFNLPFDLCAIAVPRMRYGKKRRVRWKSGWGQGRGRWRRGFRVHLLPTIYEPRLWMRKTGPTAPLIQWSTYGDAKNKNPREPRGRRPFEGRFLDLQNAGAGLWWGRKLSLAQACHWAGIALEKVPIEQFGVVTPALIERCRGDVDLTWRLFLAVRDEANQHPSLTPIPSSPLGRGARAEDTPDLSRDAHLLTHLRTPASLAKAYLDRMGIRPRLDVQPDFPPDRLGQAMQAFFGGRIEAHYQGIICPVVSLDILSTYLSVNDLMQLHRLDTAARLEIEDCTDDAREMLARLTLDDLFRRDVWPRLAMFCEVEPQGDVLPVRYTEVPGDAPTMHMKRVTAPGLALWYALPDLLDSALSTGRPPRIRRAWRLVPKGMLPGLRPERFRGEVLLDPRHDFYRALRDARITDVQPRLRTAHEAGDMQDAQDLDRLQTTMKALGEPLGYGIYQEVNEKDLIPQKTFSAGDAVADVWTGQNHFVARISREEYPGRFYFPPRGAIVTAGARLLLGMMERCITEAGGAIVTMHTDSVAVVATEHGGIIRLPHPHREKDTPRTVRALSYAQVKRIRECFTPLSGIPGMSLWKREETNDPHPEATRDPHLYILSLGPGRYALFNVADDGRIILRDRKETALGHLVPPPGYTRAQVADAVWDAVIREARGDRDAVRSLPFARSPVLGRLPITTPDLLRTLQSPPRSQKTAAPPRPFGFLTTAYPISDNDDDGNRTQPVYWSGWCRLKKRDNIVGCPAPHEDCPFRSQCPLAYPIRPVTYDVPEPDVLRKGRWFDRRTLRPLPHLDAMPVDGHDPSSRVRVRTWKEYIRHTLPQENRWWLNDTPDVRVTGLIHTGKEARHLEDIAASLRIPGEEVLIYHPEDPADDDEILRSAIQKIPVGFLIKQTHRSRRGIQLFKNGRTKRLHATTRRLLWGAFAAWVREHPEAGMIVPAPLGFPCLNGQAPSRAAHTAEAVIV